ncbi:MAG: hypothetical protein HYZ95_02595 [Candidatus Omnitrophica bacterium]|nr:hypothetical protein [Candidatus Omnitrophota bacterium]
MIELVGMVGAILLPFWNIPLILRIQHRKSSRDISLGWALGVFACLVAMLPAGLRSADPIFRAFTVINLGFFTAVVVQVLRYR